MRARGDGEVAQSMAARERIVLREVNYGESELGGKVKAREVGADQEGIGRGGIVRGGGRSGGGGVLLWQVHAGGGRSGVDSRYF